MNLFKNTLKMDEASGDVFNSLDLPWQKVSIISSNCPEHIGVRLGKIGDNMYQCPKGKEIYKSNGSVSSQTNRDNYYLGIVIK